ncbi:MAG: T9SS type A sorting domain-containing protein [Melioribacteraceae bacterium]|nr:T9SS type A sorting domain-containing protein [Melioribacteraceae bacterium]MCF8263124.1 T9SS type A sorting domain-containing protein [Melioribacteraceae bacterium]MCF8430544.1 T9SS type A sorting domain-containing protein [Melioribacteraceae bacterium]
MKRCVTVLIILLSTIRMLGQDGKIDSTFGTNGRIVYSTGSGWGNITTAYNMLDMARQSDGRMILLVDADSKWKYLKALPSNGNYFPDRLIHTAVYADYPWDVEIQDDDKIVVFGLVREAEFPPSGYKLYVKRFNSDGSVDSDYGEGGEVFLTGDDLSTYQVAGGIQDDGKMIAAAFYGGPKIYRVTNDGKVDSSFGIDGLVAPEISFEPKSIEPLPNGKILIIGQKDWNIHVLRLTETGRIDSTYGINGYFIQSTTDSESIWRTALQADGKLLIAGSNFTTNEAIIMRLSQTGLVPDITFAGDGVFNVQIDGRSTNGSDVEVLEDGRILLSGYYSNPDGTFGSNEAAYVLRLTPNGLLDDSEFGSDGISRANLSATNDRFQHMELSPNGDLYFAATVSKSFSSSYQVPPMLQFIKMTNSVKPYIRPKVEIIDPGSLNNIYFVDYRRQIKWEVRAVEEIDLDYSTDGSNWKSIVEKYDASIGYYLWDIPFDTSETVQIRISKSFDSLTYHIFPDTFAIRIFESPVPTPWSPEKGAKYIAEPYRLIWKTASSDSSKIQVASDSLFSNVVLDTTVRAFGTNSFDIKNLDQGTTYYWRTNSMRPYFVSDWSEVWSFETLGLPAQTTLLTPTDNSESISINQTFSWRIVPHAEKYFFELKLDTLNSSTIKVDSTLTDSLIVVDSLEHSTKYFWRVKAGNQLGWGEFCDWFSFETIIEKPETPTQTSPLNNQTKIVFPLEFVWNSSARAENYNLQIAEDFEFQSIVVDTSLADTSLFVERLNYYSEYFFRLKATNLGGESPWSDVRSFRSVGPSETVSIGYPENEAVDLPIEITFFWDFPDELTKTSGSRKPNSISNFWFELDSDTSNQGALLIDSTIVDTFTTVKNLDYLQTYFWRVRAKNETGWNEFSPWSKFTTMQIPRELAYILHSDSAEGFTGQVLAVKINFEKNNNPGIISCDFQLKSPPDYLKFDGIDELGSLTYDAGWSYEHNELDSVIYISYAGADSINSSGLFTTLVFQIDDNAPAGKLNFEFISAVFDSGKSNVLLENSEITISKFILPGDVDQNGIVQAHDAAKILQHLVGIDTLSADQLLNAEVTGNDTLSAMDASLILQYNVQLIDTLPYTEISTPTGALKLPDQVTISNELIVVPILTEGTSEIFGYEVELQYDPTILEFSDFEFPSEMDVFTKARSQNDGIINLVGASSVSNLTQSLFGSVKFTLKSGTPNEETSVILSKARFNESGIKTNVDTAIISTVTGLEEITTWPTEFELSQNYPNPFNPTTTIKFSIPGDVETLRATSLRIYDVLGNEVQTLVNEAKAPGNYEVQFDASKLSSGIYFYKLASGKKILTNKMVLMK